MAYIVLALGLLMAAAGCYEIYYGSNYISLEQGWSAFISGTVLLTGGLLAIALAAAIRALTNLRSALLGVIRPAAPDLPSTPPTLDRIGDDPVGAPHDGTLVDTLRPALFPPSVDDEGDAGPAVAAGVPPREAVLDVAPANMAPADMAPANMVPANMVPANMVPANMASAEPAGVHSSGAAAPPMDDWLDRGFTDPDEEATDKLPAAPTPERDRSTAATKSIDHAEPKRHTAAPEVADAAPSPQDERKADIAPAPESPVIGRYEADGTSYIMYADGSIEAQSEAGVYRFASMAELKSFIEG